MGEILTNAVTFLEYFVERRRDNGRFRIVLKIVANPVHQIDRAGKDAHGPAENLPMHMR